MDSKTKASAASAPVSVEVTVAGETLRLTGVESEEYIKSVAQYIDDKINELLKAKKTLPVNSQFMKILLPLNIADDLFREREANQTLEAELDKFMIELGKLQQENFLLQKTVDSLQLELSKSRQELAQFIESFDTKTKERK